MKRIAITALLYLLANTVAGVAIPRDIEERQVQPISTLTIVAATSYIYALPTPIPPSIASQLVGAAPRDPPGALPNARLNVTDPSVTGPPLATASDEAGSYTPGYRTIGYFGTWFIYDRKFKPTDLIVSQWTHLLVGFWDIGKDGVPKPIDENADTVTKLLDNPSNLPGAVNGVFEQVFRMKNENRNLKVMITFGGWLATFEGQWGTALGTPEKRATFAKAAAKIVIDLGLDGIDFDWEYPQKPAETIAHVDTLRLLRQELDAAGKTIGSKRKLLLSIAAPVGPHFIKMIDIPGINKYIDFFNLMAYDMGGSAFSKVSTHGAPYFMASDGSTEFCLVDGLEPYLSAGVPASKINVLGPIYGHSFAGTDGPGKTFTGAGLSSWGETGGVPDYSEIPQGGDNVLFEDEKILASWTYNKKTREMISFDTPKITKLKTEYMKSRGVGGTGFWAVNADKWTREGNLVNAAIEALGGPSVLEKVDNHLNYESSMYPNIKAYDGVKVPPGKTLDG
ncbi:hypothetical protein TWF730_000528 [Orbilia blumenaviensis]|uniref:chitinase n=1 Tax=Orbilia blumenaviensis TaxID=1796055 RepID=A0AAV9VP25_9PEZI